MGVKCRCTRERQEISTRRAGDGLRAFRGFLEGDGLTTHKRASRPDWHCNAYLLFTHGGDDGDKEIFTFVECRRNLSTNITLRDFNIVLRGAILGHQIKESIVNVDLKSETV